MLIYNYKHIKKSNYYITYMYRLYFNGISKGISNNNGPSGCGGVIVDKKKLIHRNNVISSYKKYLGIENTNYAEFMGLFYGLMGAKRLNIKNIEIFGDSKFVISQCCNSQYVNICNQNNTKIKDIYDKIKNIEKEFDKIEYFHIYEENNLKANKLATSSLKENFNTIKII